MTRTKSLHHLRHRQRASPRVGMGLIQSLRRVLLPLGAMGLIRALRRVLPRGTMGLIQVLPQALPRVPPSAAVAAASDRVQSLRHHPLRGALDITPVLRRVLFLRDPAAGPQVCGAVTAMSEFGL